MHISRVKILVMPKECANREESGGSSCLLRKLGNFTFAKPCLGKDFADFI